MKFLKNANGSSRRLSDSNLLLVITIAIFVVMYICAVAFIGSGFTKVQTFFNILNENAALIILSCGMSLVMITGGIDISVGAVTALVCMCCAMNLDYGGGNVVTSVLIALGIGTAFGLVQGYLIAYLEIQPFIVTLAGMFFAKGMTTIVNATQFNVENEEFRALKETRISLPGIGSTNKHGVFVPAYIEIGVVVALLIVAILFCVPKMGQARTRFLRYRRQQPERKYARHQRQAHKVLRLPDVRSARRYRRLCLLPSCRIRFTLPCKRSRDERDCFLHHRRHDALRRFGQHHRNAVRRHLAEYDKEHRFLPRT